MVDKNGNGVDDAYERDRKNAGQLPRTAAEWWTTDDSGDRYAQSRDNTAGTNGLNSFWAGLGNMATDASRRATNFRDSMTRWATGRAQAPDGGGLGDRTFGSERQQPKIVDLRGLPKQGPQIPQGGMPAPAPTGDTAEAPAMTFADAFAQAMGMVGGQGYVNYDPERQTARANASEADARLEAMYRQLSDSIKADASGITSNYDTALAQSKEIAAETTANMQGAAAAANAQNTSDLAALGIGEAASQIQSQGRDIGTQTARAVQDQAPAQAAQQQQLVQNKGSALDLNNSMAGASSLEGNLQRAQQTAQLNALLASIDMEEQQTNAAAGQQNFSTAMNLANTLFGYDQESRNSQGSAYNEAMKAAQEQSNWQAEFDAKYGANSMSADGFTEYVNSITNSGLMTLSDDEATRNDQLKMLHSQYKSYNG